MKKKLHFNEAKVVQTLIAEGELPQPEQTAT